MEISEKYLQRKLIKLGNDISNLAHDYSNIDDIKKKMSDFMMEGIKQNDKSFVEEFFETVDSLGERGDVICNFGYEKMNNLKGYVEGNLITIGARPKIGKSAFALNLMKRISEQGIKTALFSLEMGRKEISERFISMLTATSSYRLDHLTDDEKAAISSTATKHVQLISNMEVIDKTSSSDKIFSQIRRLSFEGYKIIFIDYLQLIKGEGANANDRIGRITTELKRLASELGICIVILSQLNRDGAKGTPELHNLRDSGNIEQDSNMVIFLNRSEDVPKVLEVVIAANRSGPTFAAELTYIKEFYSILN